MPVLSYVHHLCTTDQGQAYMHTLRWKDRPLPCPRCQSQAQDIGIVKVVVLHERQILAKQVIDMLPLLLGKDRLPDAQARVCRLAQVGAGSGRPGQDAWNSSKSGRGSLRQLAARWRANH
jgi:hypothetical protein